MAQTFAKASETAWETVLVALVKSCELELATAVTLPACSYNMTPA